jgi:hypothetical protein
MIYDGKVMTSLSAAAHAVTGNSVNGWVFWAARAARRCRLSVDGGAADAGRGRQQW